MWTSLWTYAPTPEQLAFQEKKKAFVRQVDALDQQINDQRPEDEDEEKLRIFMTSAAADGGEDSSATAVADGRGGAGRGPTLSSFSIIPSVELDKALNECSGSLQNFILKVDWALLFPYHDETKIAEEKAELEALQRKLEVAYYNLIAKVGPYRPLDPTLLSAAQIPQIVVPALQVSRQDELLAGVGFKEEGQGVGSFDILQLDFCERLMRESNAMAFWSELVERRGVFAAYWGFRKTSKNRYVMTTPSLKGVLLNDANGSYPFLRALVKQAIEPVVSSHAEKTRNVRVSLQPRSCKLFSYCMDDIGMSDHFYHKSETGLAVNICLGRDFVGANLLVTDESGTRLSVPQVAGRALVFNAETKVATETIMGGERYNMIIYCDVKEEPISQPTTTTTTAAEFAPQLLLDLPEPVKHRILSELSLNDLRALTLTSNALFKLVTYQSLPVWQQLCAKHAYPHAQEENWRRSFINGHKSQLLKRWREQERKREQKKLFNEGLAEGYFMHDFDAVERFEEETGGLKRRHPWGQGADGEAGAAGGSNYYGVGQDGLQMPPQMWTCCVLQ